MWEEKGAPRQNPRKNGEPNQTRNHLKIGNTLMNLSQADANVNST